MKTSYWKAFLPEYKVLLKLGSPILLAQLGTILLAFSDTLMVGHYGVNELAASAFVNSLYLVSNVMLIGLSGGVTPLVGALFSRGANREVGRTTRGALQVNLIMALIFTALMAGLYFLLPYFGQEEDLMPLIRSYYLVLLPQPLMIAAFFVIMQTSNGVNLTSLPMWVTLFMVMLNIAGNWLLIYGHCGLPEWGLFGAGVATILSRLIALVIILLCFRMLRRFRNYQEGFLDGSRLGQVRRNVWFTSWPLMIQSGLECLLWSVGVVVVGWFGAIQLAAYQVVNTIGQLGFMIYMSFGTAVTIRVANYAGLKDEPGAGRAARAGLHINLVLATLASILFIFVARPLINLFVNTDPEVGDGLAVVASALGLVVPLIFYQYMDAVQITMCNAIRGTSQVRPLMWISLISYVIIGIPMLLLFAAGFDGGNVGAYWSFNVALLAMSILSIIVFKRARFKEVRMD